MKEKRKDKRKMRRNVKENRGITLIALVVTIIVLIILAGVSISLILENNGIITKAKEAKEGYSQAQAREKLEIVLAELQTDKNTEIEYNEEYIDNKIEQNDMKIDGEIVIVDGWQFEIDRSVPSIIAEGEKISEEEFEKLQMRPSIIAGEIKMDITQMQISIKLKNGEEADVTYLLEKVTTGEEIKRVEKVKDLTYTFSDLEEGTEYKITIQVENLYGKSRKIKKVSTLNGLVPKLTENNEYIIQEGFRNTSSDYGIPRDFYHAFDRDETTNAETILGDANAIGSYIGYDFSQPVSVQIVRVDAAMDGYKIQYSDDLEAWFDAAERHIDGGQTGFIYLDELSSEIGSHRYWRLIITAGCSNTAWTSHVDELQFFHGTSEMINI